GLHDDVPRAFPRRSCRRSRPRGMWQHRQWWRRRHHLGGSGDGRPSAWDERASEPDEGISDGKTVRRPILGFWVLSSGYISATSVVRSMRCVASGASPTSAGLIGSRCPTTFRRRSEEHTSELQSRFDLVCRLLLEKKT